MMNAPPVILIVDDDADALFSVSKTIEAAGYRTLSAQNAREAMEIARASKPDLALLDVMMPGMDGFEALRQIRADPQLKDLFVVHLSAMEGSVDAKMSGLREGADGFIGQPVENKELIARVQAFLRHKETIDSLRASEKRFRAIFESNPHPMWIWADENKKMLAVNDSAVRIFNIDRADFLELFEHEVLRQVDPSSEFLFGLSSRRPLYIYKTSEGETLEFEITEQALSWGEIPAHSVIAFDVTERNRVEREKVQHIERFLRELDSAARVDYGDPQKAPRKEPPIRQKTPDDFDRLIEAYIELLKIELDRMVFRESPPAKQNVKNMAEKLYTLGATGRDVIELHYSALKKLAPSPDAPRAQGYLEVARLTILEMLSHLLYRYRAVAKVADSIRPSSS